MISEIKYKPLFEKLDLKNNEDVRTSVTYFKGMTSGLIDAHYTIQFLAPPIKNTFISPALSRKKAQDDFHNPFPYTEIDKSYLDPGYLSGSFATSDSGRLTVLCGTIHNHILYFHCNRFTLKEAHQSEGSNLLMILFMKEGASRPTWLCLLISQHGIPEKMFN